MTYEERIFRKVLCIIFRLYPKELLKVMEILKVAAKSNPNSVASAINQAVKAIAIARGFVAPSGIDLVCIPAFVDIVIDGEEGTTIRFVGSR